LVCERNDAKRGGEIDRALACAGAESLAPDADGSIWWQQVLDESVKHTVGVSKDLREGVRLSIEIIANDVVRRQAQLGLEPLPQSQAQPLARQALRYLYRILFLLYAEASPELEVLPIGTGEYEQGYGLDRLRELTLVELVSPSAASGTHLHDSLALLFRLVDQGHNPAEQGPDGSQPGLVFQSLRADLFLPAATSLIDAVGLSNAALQQVLRHLLLSKESRGRDRGFISYAELGINQLGAVYEGLMSYTGFFAEADLYEVAPGGDPSDGSWVVPVERAVGIAETDFVRAEDEATGEQKAVLHQRGTFVFRLAGRERQQSASYYTPEVLTRFTVSQALAELLDQDGTVTTAQEILSLTICEPALGSGAFAIEAVRQLAEQYLRRRQTELGTRIDPDAYPAELQRVKAYIALHQVYGVDLNATAIELAEISLWLDTMVSGLQAPWFGLHLRRGNSLIGARRAVYARAQVNDKSWLKATPADVSIAGLADDLADGVTARQTDGRIHHFLLPAAGWGSAVEAKEARELAPEAAARLREWRKSVTNKPSRKQVDSLVELAHRVESLWQLTLRRLQIAEQEARRNIPLWGQDAPDHVPAVSREQIEATLSDPNGAYQRLRRVMDAWAALWFWPLTDTGNAMPPSLDEWIAACQLLLGRDPEARRSKGRIADLASTADWNDLTSAEQLNLTFAATRPTKQIIEDHPWLGICEKVAGQQGFFHWELDFATVFARGGFDFQIGNPPWVRPRTGTDALMAEGDPWWQLANKPSEADRKAKRAQTLNLPGIRNLVIDGTTDVVVTAEYLGSVQAYLLLAGLQTNLYLCFIEQAWRHSSHFGVVALVHPEAHFTAEKAGLLREHTYRRLRRHWQFINELLLYEIEDHKRYGIHVYGRPSDTVEFLMASSLYHPDTVERSLRHDGSGEEPGFKDADRHWDLRPHRERILRVTDETLRAWHAIMEDGSIPVRQSRMVYTVNTAAADVLATLSRQPRAGALGLEFSAGWHETADRKNGYFELRWGAPASWDDVILQGPHLFVATPMYKSVNPTMKHNQDWSDTDFEALAADAIPVTAYKPAGNRTRYDADYGQWDSGPVRAYYRIAWRRMAANTGQRTLIPALIPPGAAHPNPVYSVGLSRGQIESLCVTCGFLVSLLSDFAIRAAPKGDITLVPINRLPTVLGHPLQAALVTRTLRLNCVTDAYASLWRDVYQDGFAADRWASGRERANRPALGAVAEKWTARTPMRIAEDRRQALVEIDALVALMLGVTADQLCTIYRTQFAVLYGYDHREYVYDANGRLVPNSILTMWRSKGDRLSTEERTATNQADNTYTYELPFTLLDREADMREAYSEFERRLAARG
ncbi:MAG TPA: class I SAM-dependent DNA methyltransferase, partial [Streptosporangiaceae bacterium]|nr:class I SAM-dependent DNA methyltransferase [Streptosporangiaceae bacterium]